MSNALLMGDGDELDLIRSVETSFGIEFQESDLQTCLTVGDLYTLLLKLVPNAERGDRCATAVAFYRLRRAIEQHGGSTVKITPSTTLVELFGTKPPRKLWCDLERDTALTMPRLAAGWSTLVLVVAMVGSPIAALMLSLGGWQYLLAVVAPAALFFVLRRLSGLLVGLPADLQTVGDLARRVSGLNAARLAAADGVQAPMRQRDVWYALEQIIRDDTGWKGVIENETRICPAR